VAATVTWNGYGRVSPVDSTTGVTALKISGTGGGPSAALADSAIEGSGAVTCVVNKQFVALYFDIGAGNELDFSGGGSEENEFVHIWGQFLAPGGLATIASDGFGIFLESSTPGTGQYHCWTFGGSDTYDGSPIRMRLDPTKTASKSAGTAINTAAIRYFGVFADVGGNTLRFDNLILDAIDVGTGLIVTGTSTTDDLKADLLADEATNKYGIFLPLNESETSIELGGTITLGDNVGTVATTITDVDASIFAAEPLYYTTASVASLPLTAFQILCVGNATGDTSITLGKIVGTDGGRNGWSITGNTTYDVAIDWDDGNVNTNKWYGCSFINLTGTLSWGTNTAHHLYSGNFSGCEQFDPVGGIVIRNTLFVGTANTDGALLWNANIDIENCSFIANTVGEGIEHDTWNGIESGTATATDGTGVTLTDSAATFTGGNVSVNDIVYNETTGGYGTVTSITDATHLDCSGGLSTGGWTSTDVYSISTPISYTNLTFSGNTVDVNNTSSPNNVLAISKAGTSDPTTENGFTVIQGSVTVKVTVKDKTGTVVSGVIVGVFITSDRTEILNADTNGSGVASTTYAGSTPVEVEVRWRKASSTDSPRYKAGSSIQTVQSGTGLDFAVTVEEDTINNATS